MAKGLARRTIVVAKVVVWTACLTPFVVLCIDAFTNQLAAEPVKDIQHRTGLTALIILLVTLAVTPLRRVTGWNELVKFRRLLGLFSFFYVLCHAVTYFVFDQSLSPALIAEDVVKHPWVTVGFTAFMLMIPLAVTSTQGWIRRLGSRWTKLHRLIYAIAILAILHFLWLVKKDVRDPYFYGTVALVLLAARLWPRAQRRVHATKPLPS